MPRRSPHRRLRRAEISALGSLVVKLALEYAQFTAGVKKSEQDALAFAKRVQDGMDKAKAATSDFLGGVVTGALAAVASYQTVATVISNVRASIDRLDALNDLSERLGVSAKALQEIGYAGVYADASIESIGKGLQKLSQNMVEANDASSKQAALFRALGVATADAEGNLRDSADVMTDLAGYFEGIEDGAVKTALAIKLFGKQGVDLIPLLNGGKEGLEKARLEAEKFGIVVGEDAVKAAAAFNDNLDRLGKITEGTYNQISGAVLPVLVAFSDAMVQASSDTQSVNAAAQELSKNGTIFEWAKNGAIGITYLMDAAEGVTRVLKALGQVAGGYFAAVGEIISGTTGAIKRALSGDISGAVSEIEGIKRRSRAIGEEITASGEDFVGAEWDLRVGQVDARGHKIVQGPAKAAPGIAGNALRNGVCPGKIAIAVDAEQRIVREQRAQRLRRGASVEGVAEICDQPLDVPLRLQSGDPRFQAVVHGRVLSGWRGGPSGGPPPSSLRTCTRRSDTIRAGGHRRLR